MADPLVMAAAGATAASGILGFKANQAQAKALRQVAEYEAEVTRQEAKLLARRKAEEEERLRQQSDRLISTQRVATAASGIQMSGSPYLALRDAYFNTEKDALMIQFASDVEQTKALADERLILAQGKARSTAAKTNAYRSLLESGTKAATLMS